mgnify:CR=1 FL=1
MKTRSDEAAAPIFFRVCRCKRGSEQSAQLCDWSRFVKIP